MTESILRTLDDRRGKYVEITVTSYIKFHVLLRAYQFAYQRIQSLLNLSVNAKVSVTEKSYLVNIHFSRFFVEFFVQNDTK